MVFHHEHVWIRRLILVVGGIMAASSLLWGRSTISLLPPLKVAEAISAQALLEQARPLLPSGAFLAPLFDTSYAVIDYHWLEHEFLPFYREAAAELRSWASREDEASDCDNYGMFLRQMMGLAGIGARADEPTAAQLIVLQNRPFSGVRRTQEKHCVGLFLTNRGWYVLEPQNGAELTRLSRYANRKTIRYITFH
jgi:hypothetical protein